MLGEMGKWELLPERPTRQKWSECVMEYMNFFIEKYEMQQFPESGSEEHVTQDQRAWKAVITHPTPS